jgi:hypothetical protein
VERARGTGSVCWGSREQNKASDKVTQARGKEMEQPESLGPAVNNGSPLEADPMESIMDQSILEQIIEDLFLEQTSVKASPANLKAANPMEAMEQSVEPTSKEVVEPTSKTSPGVKETSKATKSDNAAVSVGEWDQWLVAGLGLELNKATAWAARVFQKMEIDPVETAKHPRFFLMAAPAAGVSGRGP